MAEARGTLCERMVQYADLHELPADDRMRQYARSLERAAEGYREGRADSREFLRAWANARLYWREVTGEELV